MLDDSGSMRGQPWTELIESVKCFITELEKQPAVKENVKITVIIHSHQCRTVFVEKEPSIELVN